MKLQRNLPIVDLRTILIFLLSYMTFSFMCNNAIATDASWPVEEGHPEYKSLKNKESSFSLSNIFGPPATRAVVAIYQYSELFESTSSAAIRNIKTTGRGIHFDFPYKAVDNNMIRGSGDRIRIFTALVVDKISEKFQYEYFEPESKSIKYKDSDVISILISSLDINKNYKYRDAFGFSIFDKFDFMRIQNEIRSSEYNKLNICGFRIFKSPEFSKINPLKMRTHTFPLSEGDIFVRSINDVDYKIITCRHDSNGVGHCKTNQVFHDWSMVQIGFDSKKICEIDDVSDRIVKFLKSYISKETVVKSQESGAKP